MLSNSPTATLTSRSALAAAAALMLAAVACAPTVQQRGYVVEPDKLSSIKPHVDTKDSVTAALGTPSTVDPFDDSVWYYMSSTTKNYAFQQPHVIDRKVIEIRFDKDGTVADIQNYGMKDGKKVAMVDRITPTKGRQLSVFQQMFGNFGRLGNVVAPNEPSRPNHIPGQGPATGSSY